MIRRQILRYTPNQRTNHWLVAILFFMAALSGLALFHPALFWLSHLFGGGPWTRILHPFLGVVVFLALMFLFVRLVKYNLPEPQDRLWFANVKDVLKGRHIKSLQVGKYNAGQKLLFWGIMSLITLLLISGVLIWRPYFAPFFPIPVIRVGALLHSLTGICLILLIIGHAYMGFWVKGSIGGMVTGYVSRKWAKTHHDRWFKQINTKKDNQ